MTRSLFVIGSARSATHGEQRVTQIDEGFLARLSLRDDAGDRRHGGDRPAITSILVGHVERQVVYRDVRPHFGSLSAIWSKILPGASMAS